MDGTATFLYPIDIPPLTLPASQTQFPTLQPAGAFLQQMQSPFADAALHQQQQQLSTSHKQQQQLMSGDAAASPTSPSSVSAAASTSFLASIRRGLDDLVHQYDDDDSDDDDSDNDDADADNDASRYYSASSANTYYSPPSSLSAQFGSFATMANAPPFFLQQSKQLQSQQADDLIFDMEL